MKNEVWKQIEDLATKVGENPELASNDRMSVIIGVADNESETVKVLCMTGEDGGIFEMLTVLIKGVEDAYRETEDTNLN